MRVFQAILGLLALTIIGTQTLRHVYVRWIEPTGSVLLQFEPTKQSIIKAESLEELVKLYEPAHNKVKEMDAKIAAEKDEEIRNSFDRQSDELRTVEWQLKDAITEWETHTRELADLHFFWWSGFVVSIIGAVFYLRGSRWFGICVCFFGFSEIIWATSPSLQAFGNTVEFEQLLTFKVVYSAVSLVMPLVGWRIVQRVATLEARSINTP